MKFQCTGAAVCWLYAVGMSLPSSSLYPPPLPSPPLLCNGVEIDMRVRKDRGMCKR